MKLNYLLLDPNDGERNQIRQRLKEISKLSLVKECTDLNELEELIKNKFIDLIVIDPTGNEEKTFNFVVQHGLQKKVAFTSKKSRLAVKSFEIGILDFLQKPFTSDRFEITLDRVKNIGNIHKHINQELRKSIEVKCNLKTENIKLSSIQWIEAMGDYIKIVTHKKNFIVLSSMKKIQKNIPTDFFFRCHKSFIINTEEVINFSQTTIHLNNKDIPLSRSKKKLFNEFWSNRY
ncbi:LytTR family transcriptional regulator DNA-binding domain-containing protein [Flavobacteriaceae bacterium]|nr:LytTR family transcriptional regulator DNA-binding domain-containing protein [Flavobacteriaceae bacterium]MDB2325549.1 LytTR family transcriptional regulator DNA-binding domain-containing protein [Flavobacteriaceae bacterium]MDB2329916.1 LytTR family transcriptional regulator DNA-binding domain-containing protein [Flavobacteriaceae bacterium]MDB2456800.1 LytTR family transcriptional regulator DNA-binding domain-containing protein [Flavobacteriaceae bacterium]MDB4674504.1 LytTR family transcr